MSDRVRVGLAGLGTVGASLVRILGNQNNQLASRTGKNATLTAVSARNRNKDRGVDVSAFTWFEDPVEMARSEQIDVYIELIGGESGPAEESVRAALESGKHVITANKALLAKHGVALAKLAEDNNVSLNYEAAAAGGIPIVKALRESLAGNDVSRVYGIMNGTCNYILTRMEKEGLTFEECLSDAQRLGYAEADPTFDVEGFDTAHKLALLTSLAFGCQIDADSIYVEGISSITPADIQAADDLGYRIKLLGVAQRTDTGIEQRVHPTMVPKTSAIAQVEGVLNAVAVDGNAVGNVLMAGPGAGGDATASAVMGDVIDVLNDVAVPPLGKPTGALEPYQRARMRAHEGGYYIRLAVKNETGAFASIATRMAESGISLKSIVQRGAEGSQEPEGAAKGHPQPIILITYATTEAQVRSALEMVEKDGHIADRPQMIRIESL